MSKKIGNARLVSSFINPQTNQPLKMRVLVSIENGIYTQINFKENGEKSSESRATLFRTLPDGSTVYSYQNSGNESENLNKHTGFAIVSPDQNKIQYFNINRETSGFILLD